MITITDEASFEAALRACTEPRLRKLLTARLDLYRTDGLLSMTHLAVVFSTDAIADVEAEVGWTPLANPTDGERYGSDDFQPFWDALHHHDGYWELILAIGNSGHACILLIQEADGMNPDLRSLCRTYAD